MTFKHVTFFLLAIILLLSLPSFATSAQGTCSLATLKGTYGGFQQGTVVAQLPGVPFPSVEIGIATYDGAGHFTFTFTANLNGVVSSGTGTGAYDVKPDCSYSDEFVRPGDLSTHFAGFIAGAGLSQRVDSISIDDWRVSYGTVRKIPEEKCSLATLKRTFRGITQGTVVSLPGFPVPPPFPGAMIQSVTFDGAGNLVGSATINFGGVVFPAEPVGTYTVNSDCTYSDSSDHVGVITGAGIMQEVDYIFSDGSSSSVAVGILRR